MIGLFDSFRRLRAVKGNININSISDGNEPDNTGNDLGGEIADTQGRISRLQVEAEAFIMNADIESARGLVADLERLSGISQGGEYKDLASNETISEEVAIRKLAQDILDLQSIYYSTGEKVEVACENKVSTPEVTISTSEESVSGLPFGAEPQPLKMLNDKRELSGDPTREFVLFEEKINRNVDNVDRILEPVDRSLSVVNGAFMNSELSLSFNIGMSLRDGAQLNRIGNLLDAIKHIYFQGFLHGKHLRKKGLNEFLPNINLPQVTLNINGGSETLDFELDRDYFYIKFPSSDKKETFFVPLITSTKDAILMFDKFFESVLSRLFGYLKADSCTEYSLDSYPAIHRSKIKTLLAGNTFINLNDHIDLVINGDLYRRPNYVVTGDEDVEYMLMRIIKTHVDFLKRIRKQEISKLSENHSSIRLINPRTIVGSDVRKDALVPIDELKNKETKESVVANGVVNYNSITPHTLDVQIPSVINTLLQDLEDFDDFFEHYCEFIKMVLKYSNAVISTKIIELQKTLISKLRLEKPEERKIILELLSFHNRNDITFRCALEILPERFRVSLDELCSIILVGDINESSIARLTDLHLNLDYDHRSSIFVNKFAERIQELEKVKGISKIQKKAIRTLVNSHCYWDTNIKKSNNSD